MTLYPQSFILDSRRYVAETGFIRLRLPHDVERVNVNSDAPGSDDYIPNTSNPARRGVVRDDVMDSGMPLPEVFRFQPGHSVLLTEPLQKLWFGINPELSGEKWRRLLGSSLAFCNNSTGFGGGTPHADYVNGKDLTAKPPSFDFSRFCGGAEVRGRVVGDRVIIQSVLTSGPLPTAEELLASPHLWFYGTSIAPSGAIYYIRKMGLDGTLVKVRIPLFTEQEIWLPRREVHILAAGERYQPHEKVVR
jgi:hypothetical protein